MVKIRLTEIITLTAVLGALAACSTPSEPVDLNSGLKGYRITCGGAYSTTSDCYERAGYICGNKGYTVVHETSINPPADANYFWNASAHEVIVTCNNK